MRTLVIGDIHGAYRALLQVLERAAFDPARDRLVSLGDIADGLPEVRECVEHLLGLPHFVAVVGNHDIWLRDWLCGLGTNPVWLRHGGRETKLAYEGCDPATFDRHRAFFRSLEPYHLDDANRLFVHGGYTLHQPIEDQREQVLAWDRRLVVALAKRHQLRKRMPSLTFDRVYVGHTPVQYLDLGELPIKLGSLWMMDTGVKNGGRLSVMDIDTEEYWQSDPSPLLYPDHSSRTHSAGSAT